MSLFGAGGAAPKFSSVLSGNGSNGTGPSRGGAMPNFSFLSRGRGSAAPGASGAPRPVFKLATPKAAGTTLQLPVPAGKSKNAGRAGRAQGGPQDSAFRRPTGRASGGGRGVLGQTAVESKGRGGARGARGGSRGNTAAPTFGRGRGASVPSRSEQQQQTASDAVAFRAGRQTDAGLKASRFPRGAIVGRGRGTRGRTQGINAGRTAMSATEFRQQTQKLREENKTVFVQGMSSAANTQEAMIQAFRGFGYVTKVQCENGGTTPHALVEFQEKSHAIRALKLSSIKGEQVKVSWARISKADIQQALESSKAGHSLVGSNQEPASAPQQFQVVDAPPPVAKPQQSEASSAAEDDSDEEFAEPMADSDEEYESDEYREGDTDEEPDPIPDDVISSSEPLDFTAKPIPVRGYTRSDGIEVKPHYRAAPNSAIKPMDLDTAQFVIGRCEEMCSVAEGRLREETKAVSIFEMLPGGDPMNPQIQMDLAVKKFKKASADLERADADPDEIRTPAALEKAMYFLVRPARGRRAIIDRDDTDFGERFRFLNDRLRAVRQDVTFQGLKDDLVVRMHEEIARFHILSSFLLLEHKEVTEMIFQNTEQMNKTLITLREFYEDRRRPGNSESRLFETEAEFQAYFLLSHLTDAHFGFYVLQLSPEIRASAPVRLALKAHAAFKNNHYTTYFRLMKDADFITACAMYINATAVRQRAMSVINTMDGKIRFAELEEWLAFEDPDEVQNFVEYVGLADAVNVDSERFLEGRHVKRVLRPAAPLAPRQNAKILEKLGFVTAGLDHPLGTVVVQGTLSSSKAMQEQAARQAEASRRKAQLRAEQVRAQEKAALEEQRRKASQDAAQAKLRQEQEERIARQQLEERERYEREVARRKREEEEREQQRLRREEDDRQRKLALENAARIRAKEEALAEMTRVRLEKERQEREKLAVRKAKCRASILFFRLHQWRARAIVHKTERLHFEEAQRRERFMTDRKAQVAEFLESSRSKLPGSPHERVNLLGGSGITPYTSPEFHFVASSGDDFNWIRGVRTSALADVVGVELCNRHAQELEIHGHDPESIVSVPLSWKLSFFFASSAFGAFRGSAPLERAVPLWIREKLLGESNGREDTFFSSTAVESDVGVVKVDCVSRAIFDRKLGGASARVVKSTLRGTRALCYVVPLVHSTPPTVAFWRQQSTGLAELLSPLARVSAPARIPVCVLVVCRQEPDSEFRRKVARDVKNIMLSPALSGAHVGDCAVVVLRLLPQLADGEVEDKRAGRALGRAIVWLAQQSPPQPFLFRGSPHFVLGRNVEIASSQMFENASARVEGSDDMLRAIISENVGLASNPHHLSHRDPEAFVECFNRAVKFSKAQLGGRQLAALDWPIPEIAAERRRLLGRDNTIRFVDSSDEDVLDADLDNFDDNSAPSHPSSLAPEPLSRKWNCAARRNRVKALLEEFILPDLSLQTEVEHVSSQNRSVSPLNVAFRCVERFVKRCGIDDMKQWVADLFLSCNVDDAEMKVEGADNLGPRALEWLRHEFPWFRLFHMIFDAKIEMLRESETKMGLRLVWFQSLQAAETERTAEVLPGPRKRERRDSLETMADAGVARLSKRMRGDSDEHAAIDNTAFAAVSRSRFISSETTDQLERWLSGDPLRSDHRITFAQDDLQGQDLSSGINASIESAHDVSFEISELLRTA